MAVVLLFVLSLVFVAPAGAQENSLPRNPPHASYRILSLGPRTFLLGKETSTLQKQLDDASSGGYQVVAGFERALILRKAPNDERYAYTVAKLGDIASMEQQMNAAAAAGFRLLPQAVLSSAQLAVMEKRWGAYSLRAQYQGLSFTTEYEMYDMGTSLAIDGRLDTSAIDERLAAAAVAGYRVVALETRDVDEKTTNEPVVGGLLGKVLGKGWTVEKHRLRRELIVLFEKATEAPAVETVREAARRYHLVTAATEAEFEEMLNRAATAGYRLLTAAPNAFPEVIAVVEKQASSAGRPTYGVLAPNKISTLTNELARAGAAGWVPHSRGLLDPSGGRTDLAPVLIVVERKQEATAGKYLVLATKRSSTLDKELNQAAAAGLELVMGGRGRGELLLVMKR